MLYVYVCRCFIVTTGQQIRLVDGSVARKGRVELRNGCYSEWGTVCDDKWDIVDAQTACHQLGYSTTGVTAYSSAAFGRGTGDILLGDLKCNGKESSLFECPHDTNTVDCNHYDDAGVSCPRKQIVTIVYNAHA